MNCYFGLLKWGGADVYSLCGRPKSVKMRAGALGLVTLLVRMNVEQQFGHRVHFAAKLIDLGVAVAVRR